MKIPSDMCIYAKLEETLHIFLKIGKLKIYTFLGHKKLKHVSVKFTFIVYSDSVLRNVCAK